MRPTVTTFDTTIEASFTCALAFISGKWQEKKSGKARNGEEQGGSGSFLILEVVLALGGGGLAWANEELLNSYKTSLTVSFPPSRIQCLLENLHVLLLVRKSFMSFSVLYQFPGWQNKSVFPEFPVRYQMLHQLKVNSNSGGPFSGAFTGPLSHIQSTNKPKRK